MDFTTRRVAYVPLLPQEKAFTPQANSEAIFLNFIPFAKHKRVRATRHYFGFRWTKEPHQEVQPHGYKFGNTGCRRRIGGILKGGDVEASSKCGLLLFERRNLPALSGVSLVRANACICAPKRSAGNFHFRCRKEMNTHRCRKEMNTHR